MNSLKNIKEVWTQLKDETMGGGTLVRVSDVPLFSDYLRTFKHCHKVCVTDPVVPEGMPAKSYLKIRGVMKRKDILFMNMEIKFEEHVDTPNPNGNRLFDIRVCCDSKTWRHAGQMMKHVDCYYADDTQEFLTTGYSARTQGTSLYVDVRTGCRFQGGTVVCTEAEAEADMKERIAAHLLEIGYLEK